jgi:hypothetical protein
MFSPAISPAGQFQRINAFGAIDLRLPAETTGGIISIWESIAAPDSGPPLHVHTREDEIFYVLAGTFQFWCGDETLVGGPGTTMVLPKDVPHTYRNVGQTEGRLLGAAMPGGLENFFLDVERDALTAPGDIAACAARYGLTFVQPRADAA